MREIPYKYRIFFIYLTLALVSIIVFWQLIRCDFIIYDDAVYVTGNPHVLSGFTLENIIWAFNNYDYASNWHPLTWLSHMLDCKLFGLAPSYHHLTNLLLHIANTLLLFAALKQMTSTIWRSAFVAALFAIHPLHVESVAWIAERKDVLSTFFWMLTMICYVQYVKRPSIASYLLTLLMFALGLMAKPMLVTLPFVLLLLDYWPLNRLENISFAKSSSRQTILRLVREKIPFFVLSAASSGITFFAQQSGGSVVKLAYLPLHLRLANAVLSYVKYISKMIWPKDLIVFYPFRGDELTPAWVLLLLAFLVIVSIRMVTLAPTYRYLPVGWFWYLGTLIPVLGIVQVGSQALADRYTYVPLIGIFIIFAWGLNDLFAGFRHRWFILGSSALAIFFALTVCTRHQVGFWKDGVTLFEHALKVADTPAAHDNLANVLAKDNRLNESLKHYKIALQMSKNPDPEMLYNFACVYNNLGRDTEAIETFKQVIKIKPDYAQAYNQLGYIYYKLGRYAEAIDVFRQAIAIKPDLAEAHNNLGNTLGRLGHSAEAIQACTEAIKIRPDFAEAHCNLGAAYLSQGDLTNAINAFKKAIQIKPHYAQAHYNLGLAFLQAGDKDSALKQCDILRQLNQNFADALLQEIQK